MVISARRVTRLFDNEAPLFYGRDANVEGVDVKTGDPVATHLDFGVRLRLWLMSRVHTAQEMSKLLRTPFENDPVTMTEEGSHWYSISAPWLETPIKVQGKKKADARLAEVRAEGPPAGWKPKGEEIPEPIVLDPGDIVMYGDPAQPARIDAIDEDEAAVSFINADGEVESALVKLGGLVLATEDAADAFEQALTEAGAD